MAKSARSSTKKASNRRKAATIYGPAELSRDKRLSAKLLQLANQPKSEATDGTIEETKEGSAQGNNENKTSHEGSAMDIDASLLAQVKFRKNRISKKNRKISRIVFPKSSDRVASQNKRKKSLKT